jgi:spermidine/putrescine transport system substrate-binding protein
MVAKMVELKLLRPLDKSRLNGLENLLPQFLTSPSDPGNQYSIPMSWGTTGLVYNTDKLQDPPQDWDYLWKNKSTLFRKISLVDDTREVMGATLRMLGYSYNSKNPKEIEAAFKKLVELKPAISAFTTDAWKDQLISGDLYISMAYSADALNAAKENPKLRYVIPKSGTSLWNDRMVIPKTAPNIDAAYAWMNYMMEPSVAANLSERLLFATPNRAAYEVLPTDLQNDEELFPSESLLSKSESIAPLGNIDDVYINYWTRLAVS